MKRIITFLLLSIFILSCKKEEPKKEEQPTQKVEVKKDTALAKPVKKAPIKVREPEIRFSVQIGAFKQYGQSFSQIPNVIEYRKDGYSKYSLGSFKTVREAVRYMYSIEEDYPDAFVQALKDGEPISLAEATKQ